MPRFALVCVLFAIAAIALACGGSSSGSVTHAATVVPIKHIDFTGVQLNLGGPIAPQFLNRYPAVVMTVNGESITGLELVSVEYIREANKRQALDPNDPRFSPKLATQLQASDPLDGLISQTVMRQAVARLGYLPTYQEAVEATRKQEQATRDALSAMSPQDRQLEMERLKSEGDGLDRDWTSNKTMVEGYRQNMGLQKLESEECRPETVGPDYTPPAVRPTYRSPCTDFLARERKTAKIVYYARWAD